MTMKMFRMLGALAIALAVGLPAAHAQQPTPTAVATARKILELKQAQQIYGPLVGGIVSSVKNDYMRSNLELQKELNEVGDQIMKAAIAREEEIANAFATSYASSFTEQELNGLLAFYSSPLGRKAIQTEPQALDKSMQYLDKWAREFAEETSKKFRSEMKKRGHDI